MTSVSGLSAEHRAEARRIIVKGCAMLLAHRTQVRYTQDPVARWEAIAHDLRIAKGEWLKHGDCSSTQTWLIYNALTHVHAHRDTVNGLDWKAGYTGTIATHGKPVAHLGNAQVGDSVLYGRSWPYEHVATYLGGGIVFSHGSDAGPYRLAIDYRPDRAMIRRHI